MCFSGQLPEQTHSSFQFLNSSIIEPAVFVVMEGSDGFRNVYICNFLDSFDKILLKLIEVFY